MNIRMSAAALLLLTGAACGGAEDDTFTIPNIPGVPSGSSLGHGQNTP